VRGRLLLACQFDTAAARKRRSSPAAKPVVSTRFSLAVGEVVISWSRSVSAMQTKPPSSWGTSWVAAASQETIPRRWSIVKALPTASPPIPLRSP